MEDTLARYPRIVRRLIRLFVARFDPDADPNGRDARGRELTASIEAELDVVAYPDQDSILRRLLNTLTSRLRTYYFPPGATESPQAYLLTQPRISSFRAAAGATGSSWTVALE